MSINTNTIYTTSIKPFGDFIGALGLAIFLVIPFLIIWLVLYISGTRSPIFKQDRPGKNEKIFNILKFKTMTDEKDSNGVLLPDEKRTTKLGDFLRKTSLDEIPQIINILKGEMSFIGPRPLRTRYLPYYTKEESVRHSIKPGITGLAQVSGRNAINWDDKLKYDIRYLNSMSFSLDIKILFKTFLKVFNSSEINLDMDKTSFDFDEYRKNKLKTEL
ncbi:UNVERIFIED_CONTAM: hypothetical protein GTU68_044789 [Idotea baltica]|nr:hypothetical protein [Idotea baltica]